MYNSPILKKEKKINSFSDENFPEMNNYFQNLELTLNEIQKENENLKNKVNNLEKEKTNLSNALNEKDTSLSELTKFLKI